MSWGSSSSTVTSEEGRVDDLQSILGGSQYGANIPHLLGTGRMAGNLVWAAKPVEHVRVTETTTGDGKAEVTQVTTTYWYTCSFAVMLCAGPVYGVSKIWAAGTMIYDLSNTASAGSVEASNRLLANHLTIYTGTDTQGQDSTIVADKGAANTPAYRGRVILVFRDLDLTPYGNRLPLINAEVVEYGELFGGNQITPKKRSVAAVLTDLCSRAGINPALVDVSALTDELYGIQAERGTYRDFAQHLIAAYAIRPCASGNMLKFRPSTLSSVDVTVDPADLGTSTVDKIGQRLKLKRKRDFGLPRKVQVTYSDINRQDERSTQTRRRMAPGGSSNDIAIDLPMLLDAATAAKIAETRLFRDWVERDTYELPLGPKYLKLDAADILSLTDGATTHKFRAKKIAYGYNGQLKIDAVAYDPAASVSSATGTSGSPTNSTIPSIGSTTGYMLDLPALRDDLADARLFFAAAGASAGWRAAMVYGSADGGVSYSAVGRLNAKSTIGLTVAALPNAPALGATFWDDVSTVDVDLLAGTLESLDEIAVRGGANAAIIGNEIIQFGTATLISTGRYRLSHLLRGRRGTEWAMTGHAAGERFILLSTIGTAAVQLSAINASRLYKIVPDGLNLSDVSAQSFIWTGEVLRPFSPVQAKASRNGTTGDITLTWIRRSRVGQEMPSGADIPLGEASEVYEVDVLNSSGVVVRTIKPLTSATAIYTGGEQNADFGGWQSSVRFNIFQMSETVGRGRVLDVTL